MRRCAFSFALLTVGLGVPNWATGQKQTEVEKLHGTWIHTTTQFMGRSKKERGGATFILTKDGKLTLKEKGKPDITSTFKIDPAKNPKQFDTIESKETDKDKMVRLGIYHL